MGPNPFGAEARDLMLECIDRVGLAVMLLDGTQRVLFASRAAVEIVRAGDGLIWCSGRLIATSPDGRHAFAGALDRARTNGSPSGAAVHRPSGRVPLQVTVIPMGAPGSETPVAVSMADPVAETAGVEPLLRERYGLSAAEASVASMLVEGLDLGQVAAARGKSRETVRRQLRAIFDKVGVRRQIDLMRVVYRGSVTIG